MGRTRSEVNSCMRFMIYYSNYQHVGPTVEFHIFGIANCYMKWDKGSGLSQVWDGLGFEADLETCKLWGF